MSTEALPRHAAPDTNPDLMPQMVFDAEAARNYPADVAREHISTQQQIAANESGRHRAAEANQEQAVGAGTMLARYAAARIGRLAGNFANRINAFSEGRSVEPVTSHAGPEAPLAERGREVARYVGAAIVKRVETPYGETKAAVVESYDQAKTISSEMVASTRGYFREKADAARARKNSLLSTIRERSGRAAEIFGAKVKTAHELGKRVVNTAFETTIETREEVRRISLAAKAGVVVASREVASVPREIAADVIEVKAGYANKFAEWRRDRAAKKSNRAAQKLDARENGAFQAAAQVGAAQQRSARMRAGTPAGRHAKAA